MGSLFTSQTGWYRFLASMNNTDMLTYITMILFIYLAYPMLSLLNMGFHIIDFYPSILSISILINKLLTIYFSPIFFVFLLFSFIFIFIITNFQTGDRTLIRP